jgi:hypothetical protein
MSTFVAVNTYTHSVTYVTGKILASVKQILIWCGLDPNKMMDQWTDLDRGIATWIRSQHLKRITLQIFNPSTSALVGRWDFHINYTYGSSDDGSMWADTDAIRNAITKAGVVAKSCSYDITVSAPGGANVSGWSDVTMRSTTGFTEHSVGNTVGANSIGASTTYWRK